MSNKQIRFEYTETIITHPHPLIDTPSLAAQLLDVQNGKKSDENKENTCQIGLELVDVIEHISVGKSGNKQFLLTFQNGVISILLDKF